MKTPGQKGEVILYPCYFDATIPRAAGRRVPMGRGVPKPNLPDLVAALNALGLPHRTEMKHHPAHWFAKGGRVVVTTTAAKSLLIRKVAAKLEVKPVIAKSKGVKNR
ncbi:MAG: signal recognition particle protein Srp19 [Methanomicrobiales archaeon]|nr:signal recognition particle protein Srp19 [Methanomicrobiales archaeon]